MLTAFAIGILAGFFLSIAPGPLFVAVTRHGLEGNAREGYMIALAAAAMDVLYSLVAAFASSAIVTTLREVVFNNEWFKLSFQTACVVILLALGIRYLRHKKERIDMSPLAEKEEEQEKRARKLGYTSPFLVGVLIAVTNLASPTFLPSMIAFISYLHGNGIIGSTPLENIGYSIGFGVGTAVWLAVVLAIFLRHRAKFSDVFLSNVYKVAGVTFILCAGLLTYKVIVTTEWVLLMGM
jgi:threonine/homoserine/homoserine lactone efflux protein